MANYWASKDVLPSLVEGAEKTETLNKLHEMQEALRGLTIEQGQVNILGALDMLGALEYHHSNFVRIVQGKASGDVDFDSSADRYEAVAYINRIGQFYYFAKSNFVKFHLQHALKFIPSLTRLLPFRMKYSAHRSLDDARGEGAGEQIGHEISMGAVGGKLFVTRKQVPLNLSEDLPLGDLRASTRRLYQDLFLLFQIFDEGTHIEFNLELEHHKIIEECLALMGALAVLVKKTYRGEGVDMVVIEPQLPDL